MSSDTISTIGKFVIAGGIVAICGYIVATAVDTANLTQAWSMIALVTGWIIRDSAGQAATTNAVKTINAASGA